MTRRAAIAALPAPAALLLAILTTLAILLGACLPPISRGSSGNVGSAGSATLAPPTVAIASGPTPIPTFVRPTPTPAPTFLVYIVKSGDNLDQIAHRFGTTGRSIAYWNRGTYPSLDPESPGYRPNLLKIGWSLVLIPNVVVDEQALPEPTPNPTEPSEAGPSDSPAAE